MKKSGKKKTESKDLRLHKVFTTMANKSVPMDKKTVAHISERHKKLITLNQKELLLSEALIRQYAMNAMASGNEEKYGNKKKSDKELLADSVFGGFNHQCKYNLKSSPYCFGEPTNEILGEKVLSINHDEIVIPEKEFLLPLGNQLYTHKIKSIPQDGKLSMALGLGTSSAYKSTNVHMPIEITQGGPGVFNTLMERSTISSSVGEFFSPPCGYSLNKKSTINVQTALEIGDPSKPFFLLAITNPFPQGFLQAFGRVDLILIGPNGIEKVKSKYFLNALQFPGSDPTIEQEPTKRQLSINNSFELEVGDLPWVYVGISVSLTLTRWWLSIALDSNAKENPKNRGGLGLINLLDEEESNQVHPALANAGAIKISRITMASCSSMLDDHLLEIH